MNEYIVVWVMQLDADSPMEAAEEARRIQLDLGSYATSYEVSESCNVKPNFLVGEFETIDLDVAEE